MKTRQIFALLAMSLVAGVALSATEPSHYLDVTLKSCLPTKPALKNNAYPQHDLQLRLDILADGSLAPTAWAFAPHMPAIEHPVRIVGQEHSKDVNGGSGEEQGWSFTAEFDLEAPVASRPGRSDYAELPTHPPRSARPWPLSA